MEKHLFSILALNAILLASVTALYSAKLALYILGCVLICGIVVVILRIRNLR